MEEEFNLENPLTGLEDHQSDTIPSLFTSETDHMPCSKYFNISVRRETITLILNVKTSCKLDPFVSYLAINYLDRFISKHRLLPQGKPWILKLVSISCLSLASKMRKINFSLNDFQGEEQLIFSSQSIQRMELLILGALEWRLRSITPFSFICYFISFFKLNDLLKLQSLKDRATEILFKYQNEMKFLEFKPSIMAASALLTAANELSPLQFPYLKDTISSCEYVIKEELLDCYNLMEDFLIYGWDDSTTDVESTSNTAVSVLEMTTTIGCIRSEVHMIKRRRINEFGSAFQFSQIQHC